MKPKLKKAVLLNAGWILGLVVLLAIGAGFFVSRLDSQSERLGQLRAELEAKKASLFQPDPGAVDLDRLAALQDERLAMVANESDRVSEISRAAAEAGVTLIAIKVLEQEHGQDGLVSVAHELGALGSYRALGQFFSHVYGSRGAVGLEELEVRRRGAGPLHASLRVVWYANEQTPAAPANRGEG